MFTQQDLTQLAQHGISVENAQNQIHSFKTGFPALDIVEAASIGKGILAPTADEKTHYLAAWQAYLNSGHSVLKFVPASGAASRMFKDLFTFLEDGIETPFIQHFFNHIEDFAFYNDLNERLTPNAECRMPNAERRMAIIRILLEEMNYGKLPKGLLLFHKYDDGPRTPAVEHLVEGTLYANAGGNINVHFTVSPEHLPLFEEHVQGVSPLYGGTEGGLHISFSTQKASTDTIAADAEGNPFRDKDGSLVFRPGGHGALIENLNEQEADVVFIKNIDNVVPDRLKGPTTEYKQLIAGILVSLQAKAFEYLRNIETADVKEIVHFLEHDLCCTIPTDKKADRAYLAAKLNRPMRVCGMVRNEGEPGGGPFLVRAADGSVGLQILESSQIADPSLMLEATHFNPVDLVCALRDYKGEAFDLRKYVDPLTAFISQKSKDGRELQALELPGLWNGAMADWNTIFVEVPIETFNPVKTVNDLLREQHQ